MTLLLLERGPASIFNWTKSTLSKSNYKDYPQRASGGGGGGGWGGGGGAVSGLMGESGTAVEAGGNVCRGVSLMQH